MAHDDYMRAKGATSFAMCFYYVYGAVIANRHGRACRKCHHPDLKKLKKWEEDMLIPGKKQPIKHTKRQKAASAKAVQIARRIYICNKL